MKKYTTFITTEKGEQKEISVWLDYKTARAIDEADDPEITRFYILDKHKEDLIQRKETRRHTSLDYLFEQGRFFEDQDSDLSQHGVRMENISKVRKALSALTDKQFKAIWYVAVDGLSYAKTGRLMGIRGETVREHYKRAEEKIKKCFPNNPQQTCSPWLLSEG